MVLSATDGVECCCSTARAPRLSELTDTGVLRVKSVLQTRRLTNTARASRTALNWGSPAWARNRFRSSGWSRSNP
eukprot:11987373-Alexandrium_andersonii.AAC.1